MTQKMIFSMVFFLCGAMALLVALLIGWFAAGKVKTLQRTQAVLVDYTLRDNTHGAGPIVEFTTADGRTVRQAGHNISHEYCAQHKGQTVEILYAEKKVFSGSMWNIYVDTGVKKDLPGIGRNIPVIAICGVVGLAFIAVGLAFLKK